MLQGGTKDKQEKKWQTNFVVTTDNEEKNPLSLSLEPMKIHFKMSCSIDVTQEKGLPTYKWLTISSGKKHINSFRPLESIYQIIFLSACFLF